MHAGEADGALDDGRPSAHRACRTRQPRLQYRLVAESQIAVYVIVALIGRRRLRAGCGPGPVAHGPEPVTAVFIAVAVLRLTGVPAAASVPGLAREHRGDGGGDDARWFRGRCRSDTDSSFRDRWPVVGSRPPGVPDRAAAEQLLPRRGVHTVWVRQVQSRRDRVCVCVCTHVQHMSARVSYISTL